MMFDCHCYLTVWNRWRDVTDKHAGEKFFRFHIPVKCKYKTEIKRGTAGSAMGRSAVNAGTVIENFRLAFIPDNEWYVPPNEWVSMAEDGRRGFYTLRVADIMAVGHSDVDITGVAPFRESDVMGMLAPDIFMISAVSDNTKGMKGKHFKVAGV